MRVIRYMHLLLIWMVYMHIGVCHWGVYGGPVMCAVVIVRVCVCIWVFQCFLAATDASVDYLTDFITEMRDIPYREAVGSLMYVVIGM